MTNTVLDLNNVCYRIGQTEILHNICVRSEHHRVGIVGRNGSGKSTLARLICGLIVPSSGTLRIAGVDVAQDRHNAIRTVGMLFQNPDHQIIFPTVEEELAFGLQQLGQSKKAAGIAALAMLDKFGHSEWAAKSVSTLSQGQRHLVCLLAVLLMNPRVIVLDEPYTGLDIPTTLQLKAKLRSIEASIIHISHDPSMLSDYDHLLWIDQGRLELEGRPEQVLPVFTERMQQLGSDHALV